MVVAPMTFGQYGRRLITTDEYSGHVYAVGATGHTALVADAGLPAGGDIGPESAGFVPKGFGPGWSACSGQDGRPLSPTVRASRSRIRGTTPS